jgi:hypothetical protein
LAGEIVDYFRFAFITPLGADNYRIGHDTTFYTGMEKGGVLQMGALCVKA